MSAFDRRSAGPMLALATLLLAASVSVARAAVPEPTPPAPAEPDTSHFLPPWLHLHGSIGYGWISAPALIRERYEAGQDFEAGLEMRVRRNLRLRLNGEYQLLPAVAEAHYAFITAFDVEGNPVRDTVSIDWRQRGWLGAARLEAQVRVLPHTWLLGGVGRGYLASGVRAFHIEDPFTTLDVRFPGSSGWAWITTAGARYDFDLFGPMLGAELRWSTLDRPQDVLRTWSLRIGWQGR